MCTFASIILNHLRTFFVQIVSHRVRYRLWRIAKKLDVFKHDLQSLSIGFHVMTVVRSAVTNSWLLCYSVCLCFMDNGVDDEIILPDFIEFHPPFPCYQAILAIRWTTPTWYQRHVLAISLTSCEVQRRITESKKYSSNNSYTTNALF